MNDYTPVLGVGAALLHGTAYVLYNIQTHFGQSKPNPASWSVWTVLAIINAFSFQELSGDLVSTLQSFIGSVACIFTFGYALLNGKFSRLGRKEWFTLAMALLAVMVWWIFQNAAYANMIVLLAILVSFKPTFDGVYKDPFKEVPRSWWLWTLAYGLTTASVLIRHKPLLALLMPVALMIAHGSIAVLSSQSRKDRYSQVFEQEE
jgi:hypothetical protein